MKNWIQSLALTTWLIFSTANADIANNTSQKIMENFSKETNSISITADENISNIPYLWADNIYLAKNWDNVGLYSWDKSQKAYILQRHRDWEKELELYSWNDYEIVLVKQRDLDELGENSDMIDNLLNDISELWIEEESYSEYLLNIVNSANLELFDWEYITYLDKSLQAWIVLKYTNNKIELIWFDYISTWNKVRWWDYYSTPNMIIDRRNFARWDREALWTNNMWYWPEWSEIRWLGKYYISENWNKVSLNHDNWLNEFHFAIHTTTPWWETMLWEKMSKWCVRVSMDMLKVFRHTWILDWNTGKYLIIWDYEKFNQEWWNKIYKANSQNDLESIKIYWNE